ncbi:hypothetical protein C8Q75DRAFT_764582 [Abortiporus biennis]|nr:hypothetical protein C8Q75DRAFT_764582 [Abortiporus biennis]
MEPEKSNNNPPAPAYSPSPYPTPGGGAPQAGPTPVSVPYDATTGEQYQQTLYSRCARGDHDVVTKYGFCGIFWAIVIFPIGLLCLLCDREKRCARCGARIS